MKVLMKLKLLDLAAINKGVRPSKQIKTDLSAMMGVIPPLLRKTLKGSKAVVEQAVRARYTYKGSVRGFMKVVVNGLTGALVIRGARNSIRKFQFKPPSKKAYAHAVVVRGRGGFLPRAFYIRRKTVTQGGKHLGYKSYEGFGGMYTRVGRDRYPIKKLMSVSVAQMAGHEIPARAVTAFIEQHFGAELDAAMDRVL